MAQIQVNPWSFTNADQATTVGINSIVNNGGASALVTTASAHGYSLYQNVSVQSPAVAGYANGYKVLSIPSTTRIWWRCCRINSAWRMPELAEIP